MAEFHNLKIFLGFETDFLWYTIFRREIFDFSYYSGILTNFIEIQEFFRNSRKSTRVKKVAINLIFLPTGFGN
jgi:hypothetical protein